VEWFTSVIPATQVVEIVGPGQSGQNVSETPISVNKAGIPTTQKAQAGGSQTKTGWGITHEAWSEK
jgi:hypothetical protein